MGIGLDLWEEFKVEQGQVVTKTLWQCRIPDMLQAPEVVPIIVEDEEPSGPHGNEGLGGMGMNPTAPAIINAIYETVGAPSTTRLQPK